MHEHAKHAGLAPQHFPPQVHLINGWAKPFHFEAPCIGGGGGLKKMSNENRLGQNIPPFNVTEFETN